ncbi:MAG: flap endonuclease-1 [Candidatus Pacearchaeota archaeon]
MGVQISEIIPKKEITLDILKGKTIVVDGMNALYQFLTTIRQADGTPLMDRNGEITSHLSGMFYRNVNLLLEGIDLIYVFDGKPPELKEEELAERRQRKEEAKEKYLEAKEKGDLESMRKYASQSTKVDEKIIKETKELLEAMGIPVVDSASEGEAEAAHIVLSNLAWASASQDFDSLLYGVPRLIRNLTLSRKRRTSSGSVVDTKIELIEFQKVIEILQIDREQLICLGIIVGTDYNPGGIRGLGQKRALEIVRKYKYPVLIFEYLEKSGKFEIDFDWKEIFSHFKNFRGITTPDKLKKKKADFEKLKNLLVQRDFSEERINDYIEKLKQLEEQKKQVSLKDFF